MNIINLAYDGYLTEQKLIQLFKDLKEEYEGCCKGFLDIKTNVKVGKRYRTDIIVNDKYMIEFDGYQHYTSSSCIERDGLKDATWELEKEENRVIRIPYFVQLTTKTFNFFFKDIIENLNKTIEIKCNYEHGFIDKKAILPADFCTYGERRFIYEMQQLPSDVCGDIIISLINQLEKKEAVEIFPLNIRQLNDFNEVYECIKKELEYDPFENMNCYFQFSKNKKVKTYKAKQI